MKNLLAIAVFALFLSSCNNVAKYAESINGLSTNWDAATNAATELVNKVNEAQEIFNNNKAQMAIPEGMEVPEEQAAQLNNLKNQYMGYGEQFSAISSEVSGFVSSWQEKAQEMTALKDGLAAGKIEGDVQAKVDELKGQVEEATTKVGTWSEQLEGLKTTATETYNQYKSMLDGLMNNAG